MREKEIFSKTTANSSDKNLTKREFFAAMAMQGYCVNNDTIGVEDALIALWSVQQADALIQALNESQH